MKILISLISYDLGGSERRYYNIARALSLLDNLDVTFLVSAPVYERLCKMVGKPNSRLKVVTVFKSRFAFFLASLRSIKTRSVLLNKLLNAVLFRLRDRILDIYEPRFDTSDFDVWHKTGAPWKPCLPRSAPQNAIMTAAGNELALPGHALHVPFFRNAIINGTPIEVLTPGINNEILKFLRVQKQLPNLKVAPCSFIDHSAISKVKVEEKKKIICFLGRFHRQKNPVLFVQIAAIIAPVYPEYQFQMMGYGPLESLVTQEISKYGLNDRIKVWREDNPLSVLRNAEVFVSIQTNDNYPSQSLMEAMSCGCAILASNSGDTKLMVPEGTGVLVDLNIESLSEALLDMLKDREATLAMGQEASTFIRTNFTVERYVAYLLEVYSEVLNQ